MSQQQSNAFSEISIQSSANGIVHYAVDNVENICAESLTTITAPLPAQIIPVQADADNHFSDSAAIDNVSAADNDNARIVSTTDVALWLHNANLKPPPEVVKNSVDSDSFASSASGSSDYECTAPINAALPEQFYRGAFPYVGLNSEQAIVPNSYDFSDLHQTLYERDRNAYFLEQQRLLRAQQHVPQIMQRPPPGFEQTKPGIADNCFVQSPSVSTDSTINSRFDDLRNTISDNHKFLTQQIDKILISLDVLNKRQELTEVRLNVIEGKLNINNEQNLTASTPTSTIVDNSFVATLNEGTSDQNAAVSSQTIGNVITTYNQTSNCAISGIDTVDDNTKIKRPSSLNLNDPVIQRGINSSTLQDKPNEQANIYLMPNVFFDTSALLNRIKPVTSYVRDYLVLIYLKLYMFITFYINRFASDYCCFATLKSAFDGELGFFIKHNFSFYVNNACREYINLSLRPYLFCICLFTQLRAESTVDDSYYRYLLERYDISAYQRSPSWYVMCHQIWFLYVGALAFDVFAYIYIQYVRHFDGPVSQGPYSTFKNIIERILYYIYGIRLYYRPEERSNYKYSATRVFNAQNNQISIEGFCHKCYIYGHSVSVHECNRKARINAGNALAIENTNVINFVNYYVRTNNTKTSYGFAEYNITNVIGFENGSFSLPSDSKENGATHQHYSELIPSMFAIIGFEKPRAIQHVVTNGNQKLTVYINRDYNIPHYFFVSTAHHSLAYIYEFLTNLGITKLTTYIQTEANVSFIHFASCDNLPKESTNATKSDVALNYYHENFGPDAKKKRFVRPNCYTADINASSFKFNFKFSLKYIYAAIIFCVIMFSHVSYAEEIYVGDKSIADFVCPSTTYDPRFISAVYVHSEYFEKHYTDGQYFVSKTANLWNYDGVSPLRSLYEIYNSYPDGVNLKYLQYGPASKYTSDHYDAFHFRPYHTMIHSQIYVPKDQLSFVLEQLGRDSAISLFTDCTNVQSHRAYLFLDIPYNDCVAEDKAIWLTTTNTSATHVDLNKFFYSTIKLPLTYTDLLLVHNDKQPYVYANVSVTVKPCKYVSEIVPIKHAVGDTITLSHDVIRRNTYLIQHRSRLLAYGKDLKNAGHDFHISRFSLPCSDYKYGVGNCVLTPDMLNITTHTNPEGFEIHCLANDDFCNNIALAYSHKTTTVTERVTNVVNTTVFNPVRSLLTATSNVYETVANTYQSIVNSTYCDRFNHPDYIDLFALCKNKSLNVDLLQLHYVDPKSFAFTYNVHVIKNSTELYDLRNSIGYAYNGVFKFFGRYAFYSAGQYVPYFSMNPPIVNEYCRRFDYISFGTGVTDCKPRITGYITFDTFFSELAILNFIFYVIAAFAICFVIFFYAQNQRVRFCVSTIIVFARILDAYFIKLMLHNLLLNFYAIVLISFNLYNCITVYRQNRFNFVHFICEIVILATSLAHCIFFPLYSFVIILFICTLSCVIRRKKYWESSVLTLDEAKRHWEEFIANNSEKDAGRAYEKLRREVIDGKIGSLTPEQLQYCSYMMSCYELIKTGKNSCHVVNFGNMSFGRELNIAHPETKLLSPGVKIEGATMVASFDLGATVLQDQIRRSILVSYTNGNKYRQLYAYCHKGSLYVLRHLFGDDLRDFDINKIRPNLPTCFKLCGGVELSSIVLQYELATINEGCLMIPYSNYKAGPEIPHHDNPLTFTGTGFMKQPGNLCSTIHIFKGMHDGNTNSGWCGLPLYGIVDHKIMFLGLHCATYEHQFTDQFWRYVFGVHININFFTTLEGNVYTGIRGYDYSYITPTINHPAIDPITTGYELTNLCRGVTRWNYHSDLLTYFGIDEHMYRTRNFNIDYKHCCNLVRRWSIKNYTYGCSLATKLVNGEPDNDTRKLFLGAITAESTLVQCGYIPVKALLLNCFAMLIVLSSNFMLHYSGFGLLCFYLFQTAYTIHHWRTYGITRYLCFDTLVNVISVTYSFLPYRLQVVYNCFDLTSFNPIDFLSINFNDSHYFSRYIYVPSTTDTFNLWTLFNGSHGFSYCQGVSYITMFAMLAILAFKVLYIIYNNAYCSKFFDYFSSTPKCATHTIVEATKSDAPLERRRLVTMINLLKVLCSFEAYSCYSDYVVVLESLQLKDILTEQDVADINHIRGQIAKRLEPLFNIYRICNNNTDLFVTALSAGLNTNDGLLDIEVVRNFSTDMSQYMNINKTSEQRVMDVDKFISLIPDVEELINERHDNELSEKDGTIAEAFNMNLAIRLYPELVDANIAEDDVIEVLNNLIDYTALRKDDQNFQRMIFENYNELLASNEAYIEEIRATEPKKRLNQIIAKIQQHQAKLLRIYNVYEQGIKQEHAKYVREAKKKDAENCERLKKQLAQQRKATNLARTLYLLFRQFLVVERNAATQNSKFFNVILTPNDLNPLPPPTDENVIEAASVVAVENFEAGILSAVSFSAMPALCGTPIICKEKHVHGFRNCRSVLERLYYDHINKCQRCVNHFITRKHPYHDASYGRTIPSGLSFMQQLQRYHSCPDCQLCPDCIHNDCRRVTDCASGLVHIGFNSTKSVTSETFILPSNVSIQDLKVTLREYHSIKYLALEYGGKNYVMKRKHCDENAPNGYVLIDSSFLIPGLDMQNYDYFVIVGFIDFHNVKRFLDILSKDKTLDGVQSESLTNIIQNVNAYLYGNLPTSKLNEKPRMLLNLLWQRIPFAQRHGDSLSDTKTYYSTQIESVVEETAVAFDQFVKALDEECSSGFNVSLDVHSPVYDAFVNLSPSIMYAQMFAYFNEAPDIPFNFDIKDYNTYEQRQQAIKALASTNRIMLTTSKQLQAALKRYEHDTTEEGRYLYTYILRLLQRTLPVINQFTKFYEQLSVKSEASHENSTPDNLYPNAMRDCETKLSMSSAFTSFTSNANVQPSTPLITTTATSQPILHLSPCITTANSIISNVKPVQPMSTISINSLYNATLDNFSL